MEIPCRMINHTDTPFPRALAKRCSILGGMMPKQDVFFNLAILRASYPDLRVLSFERAGHKVQIAVWKTRYRKVYSVTHPLEDNCPLRQRPIVTSRPSAQRVVEIIQRGKEEARDGWIRFVSGKEDVVIPPKRGYVLYQQNPTVLTSSILTALNQREKNVTHSSS